MTIISSINPTFGFVPQSKPVHFDKDMDLDRDLDRDLDCDLDRDLDLDCYRPQLSLVA